MTLGLLLKTRGPVEQDFICPVKRLIIISDSSPSADAFTCCTVNKGRADSAPNYDNAKIIVIIIKTKQG